MIATTLIALVLLATPAAAPCRNPALVVDKLAAGVQYSDCWKVEYSVDEAFPASALIGRPKSVLTASGWRALDIDPTDPEHSKGTVHTWLEYPLDDKAHTRVDSWIGWFVREDSSRLQLSLRYFGRSPGDSAARSVSVGVIFVTRQEWEKRPR
jgi:hypothetical protein